MKKTSTISKGIKGVIFGTVLGIAGLGCASANTPARIQNATTSAEYQAALEICVQKAMKLIDAGTAKDEVQASYEQCAEDADKKYGRKP